MSFLKDPSSITIGKTFNCSSLCGADISLPCSIKTDSRNVKEGDIFIALKGSRVDGHNFIGDAVHRGARGIILRDEEVPKYLAILRDQDVSLFGVSSPEHAIVEAAVKYLACLSSLKKIIAVTGSVGKTTTKDVIGAVLRGKYKAHISRGNHNTLLGCSLTILSAPSDSEFLVLEMGANAKGEIAEMVTYFTPTVAVITSIDPVHLEGFGDINGILQAKLEIVTDCCDVLLINGDSSILREGLVELPYKPSKVVSVGRNPSCPFRILDTSLRWDGLNYSRRVSIATPLGVKELESKLWGEQNVNAMAVALAVGLEMGVGFDEIASSLRHMRSPRGRGALLQSKEGILFIDESYNASPVSVKAAINNLKAMPWRGRKVAVLGGMRELGGCEKQFHEEVLGVVTSVADITVLYGQEWDDLHANSTKTVLLFEEIEEVSSYLEDILLSGDVVLVKGSRFYEMERIYDRWSLDEL